MPFTISHIAAVLPLRRHCSVDEFAALAVGSVMPDMHYFLPLLRKNWPLPSHQLISLPLFCLPVGWLLWRLWRPLWTAAGNTVQPMPAWWRVLLALSIGTLTHLAWDACTHASYGLGPYLLLGQPLFSIGYATFSRANLLQYISSVAGLVFLALAAWPARGQLMRNLRAGVPLSWLMATLVLAAVLSASLTFALTWEDSESIDQLRHTIRLTAWNGLCAPLLIVVAYPVIWRLRQRKASGSPHQLA